MTNKKVKRRKKTKKKKESRDFSQYGTRRAQLATSSQLAGGKTALQIQSRDA